VRRLAVVLLCVLAVPASAHAWTWPADGPVLRPFAFDPAHPYAGGQHRGIDIGVSEGTSVRAPADGTVTFAGSVPGGGKTIAIETPFGYSATLLHLGSIAVQRGTPIAEGAVAGTAGAESFVYFGLRVSANPQGYVDPLLFLPPRLEPPPVAADASATAESAPVAELPQEPVAPATAVEPAEAPADTEAAAVQTDAPAMAVQASAEGQVVPATSEAGAPEQAEPSAPAAPPESVTASSGIPSLI